ncbi:MAG: NAD(P)/FAD-dependent oxidoreductase [Eggerthellaceae bacterium]|nr:NAD(P)/FAD-dependent oxidoreductase [Eggerthellaceae bacterium]
MGDGFTSKPVVVLGFGAAAISAICALRDSGYDGPLTVVTDADPEPYSPVLTSYYVGGRIPRDQCFPWSDLDVASMIDDMRSNEHIESIDVEAHEVKLANGQCLGYSKLLIATGAQPIAPGFPASHSYKPHVLRTMQDAERLRGALIAWPHVRVLVSGTSMVGLKALEACLDREADATLLGRSGHIMRATAHPLVAERFEQLLVDRGVTLRLSQTVVDVEESADCPECSVCFDDGDVEQFDEIILAQGVKPNLSFVAPGSIEMHKGVVVDDFMRTSAPDVFAAGDVAEALDVSSGQKRIIGLWHNAVRQGRCAGSAIAAECAGRKPTRPYAGSIPSNVIHVRDILFASAGSLSEQEGRCFDVREENGMMCVFVYEKQTGTDQLVGFNILAVVPQDGKHDVLVDEIGAYRREIFNSYV